MVTLQSLPQPQTKTFSDADRDKSKVVRQSVLATLYEATQLKSLTFQVAMEFKEQVSPDEAEASRSRAIALSGLVKAWDMACNRIRIQQGKPLPGVIKHESKPKKPKRSKSSVTLMDQDQPATAQSTAQPNQSPDSIG